MNEDIDNAKDIVNLINNRKYQYSNAQATLIFIPIENVEISETEYDGE